MAAYQLGSQHALFAVRLFAADAADSGRLKVFDKAQDSILRVLGPGLFSFTPVEF